MKILDRIDTREHEAQGTTRTGKDRMVPIPGTGDPHECDRCGELHEVHYYVQADDGQTYIVGSTCAHAATLDTGTAPVKLEGLSWAKVAAALYQRLTADLDPAAKARYGPAIKTTIQRALLSGREPNPDLGRAIYDRISGELAPEQQKKLERHRWPILAAIRQRIGLRCLPSAPCPGYCGDDRAWEGTIGKLEGWIGNATDVIYPKGGEGGGRGGLAKLRSQYALIEADRIITSHNPITFAETPGYSRGLQERAYDRDQLEQIKVIRQAEAMIPELVINTNPDAVNGPPVVDQAGLVLGGNSRAMTIKRVLSEGIDNVYTRKLADEINASGGTLGLGGAPVEGRILVRIVRGEYDPIRISRDLNRSLTQALSSASQAVSLGRMLPPRLFELVGARMFAAEGEGEGATLTTALGAESGAVVRLLQTSGIITQQNYGEYTVTRKGRATSDLSTGGRQRIKESIIGALVGDKEIMALLPPQLERTLEGLAAPAMILDTDDPGNTEGYNLCKSLRAAIALCTNRPTTQIRVFEEQFSTRELEFEGESIQAQYPEVFADPLAAILARWLIFAQGKPNVAAKAFRLYVNGTPKHGGATMFGPADPPEVLRIKTLGQAFTAGQVKVEDVESIGIMRFLAGQ